jgi:hypothetical protein
MRVAEVPAICVKTPTVTKTRISFSHTFIVRYGQEEENRQSEKLHSTLKIFVDSPAAVLRLVVARSVAPQPEASAGLLLAVFRASFPRHSLF